MRKFNPDFHSSMLSNWKRALTPHFGPRLAELTDTELWSIIDPNSVMNTEEQLEANIADLEQLLAIKGD